MSENWWIALTGYLVAVMTYLSKNFMFEPLLEFKATKGKIQNRLKYNANKYFNNLPPKVSNDAFEELRALSCELEEKYFQISMLWFFVILKIIPKSTDLSEAAREMIYISNSPEIESNKEKRAALEKIKSILKII